MRNKFSQILKYLALIYVTIHLFSIISNNSLPNATTLSRILYDSKLLVKENNNLSLNDVLIVIKTTSSNHKTRVKNIVSTWYQFAKKQVNFSIIKLAYLITY